MIPISLVIDQFYTDVPDSWLKLQNEKYEVSVLLVCVCGACMALPKFIKELYLIGERKLSRYINSRNT